MSTNNFANKVKTYLKAAGYSQKILANKIGMNASVLTHKLNGTGRFILTYPEIRNIVKTLANLEAITRRAEVRELLESARCPDFSLDEWRTAPLNDLEEAAPTNFPVLRSLNKLHSNLTVQLNSFIGREQEIAQVTNLLATTHLLTLTGTGGAGKTRLTLQVANQVLDQFSGGVWLVELASTSEPALVGQVVAKALGLNVVPGQPIGATLRNYLKPLHLLLILDNCEHLIEACAILCNDLLRSCPHMRILATSRETLNISGEKLFLVPSLSVPQNSGWDSKSIPDVEELKRFEAISLFVDRAITANPSFEIGKNNCVAVVQICQRLDGIPLAIELAAARVNLLTVNQIADRLADRFQLLTNGKRTNLPRQQTLQASIEWSYDLLEESERKVFNRLSIFSGGWNLEAAEVICSGSGVETIVVLNVLSQLLNKSLLLRLDSAASGLRFSMLETLRQYALEKLEESGEKESITFRHSQYYLKVLEEGELKPFEEMGKAVRENTLRLIGSEIDNLQSALARSIDTNNLEIAFELLSGLTPYWNWQGLIIEGMSFTRELHYKIKKRLKFVEEQPGLEEIKAYWLQASGKLEETLANGLMITGHNEEAFELYQLALSTVSENELVWKAKLIRKAGNALKNRREYNLALEYYNLAEITLETINPSSTNKIMWEEWLNIHLERIGIFYERNLLEEIKELIPKIRNMLDQYGTLKQRGQVFPSAMLSYLYRQNRYIISDEHIEYSRTLFETSREMGSITEIAASQFRLGFSLLWHLNYDEAEQEFLTCLKTAQRIEDAFLQARCLTYLSVGCRRKDQSEKMMEYINRLENILSTTHLNEYQAVSSANQGWLLWRKGALLEAQEKLEAALELWAGVNVDMAVSYPFQWLALWPLIAIKLQKNDINQAYRYAQKILLPDQQLLVEDLRPILEKAVQQFEKGNLDIASQLLKDSLEIARTNNYL